MTEGGGSVGVIMTVNLGRVFETLHRFSDVEFPAGRRYVGIYANLRRTT
jgi:hypothetical protein